MVKQLQSVDIAKYTPQNGAYPNTAMERSNRCAAHSGKHGPEVAFAESGNRDHANEGPQIANRLGRLRRSRGLGPR
jgi:hypothetical protein